MGGKVKDPEELEVETPKEDSNQELPEEVEVDLDRKETPEKKEEPVESDGRGKYVSTDEFEKVRKQLNGLSYLGRKFDEVVRKIDSLQSTRTNSSLSDEDTASSSDKDDMDELLKKDWKSAVKKLAAEEARELLKKEREEAQLEQMRQGKVGVLERNKQIVREKYPDLDDPDSETSQRYLKVLQSDPSLISNEYGPVEAMRRMEEELRNEGKIIDEPIKRKVNEEVERRTRINTTSIPRGTSQPSTNKVTLTREEQEICRHNGIRFEDYARIKKSRANSSQEGITV